MAEAECGPAKSVAHKDEAQAARLLSCPWAVTEDAIPAGRRAALQQLLRSLVDPAPKPIVVHNLQRVEPRLTAWFARDGHAHHYSGLTLASKGWPAEIQELADLAERHVWATEGVRVAFDVALVVAYRDGDDSIAAHADKDALDTYVASWSLGWTRELEVYALTTDPGSDTISRGGSGERPSGRRRKRLVARLALRDGSLMVMRPGMQRTHKHQIGKTPYPCGPRINVTLREHSAQATLDRQRSQRPSGRRQGKGKRKRSAIVHREPSDHGEVSPLTVPTVSPFFADPPAPQMRPLKRAKLH